MSLDAWELFAGLGSVLLAVAGFDLGIAFLMRAERESSTDVFEVKDR